MLLQEQVQLSLWIGSFWRLCVCPCSSGSRGRRGKEVRRRESGGEGSIKLDPHLPTPPPPPLPTASNIIIPGGSHWGCVELWVLTTGHFINVKEIIFLSLFNTNLKGQWNQTFLLQVWRKWEEEDETQIKKCCLEYLKLGEIGLCIYKF